MNEPLRLLLVDDDEVNLLLTSIALRERGFLVTEAISGERALRLLTEFTPDVIVLDALMPGLDGFAACRELRGLPRAADRLRSEPAVGRPERAMAGARS